MWLNKLDKLVAEYEEDNFESPRYVILRPEIKSEITEELFGLGEDSMFLEVNEVSGLKIAVDFDPRAKDIVLV